MKAHVGEQSRDIFVINVLIVSLNVVPWKHIRGHTVERSHMLVSNVIEFHSVQYAEDTRGYTLGYCFMFVINVTRVSQ